MNKWVAVAVLLLLGYLGYRWVACGKPAFDLDSFEHNVGQLTRAAGMAKRMSDKGSLPAYLEVDITYLEDIGDLMHKTDAECEEIADSVRERFSAYQTERAGQTDAVSLDDIKQMAPQRQREVGMQLIGHLAPAWSKLLEPVRGFCKRCPEESEVLTGALGTIEGQ